MMKTVSFSRHIEKHWLDQTALWSAEGLDLVELNSNIERLLEQSIRTKENRRKARNLLTSIWFRFSDETFHKIALDASISSDEIPIAVHWGIILSMKPFFADVSRFIGRACKLNNVFSYSQVKDRMVVLYGETETAKRGLRAVLKTMIELGVIERIDNSTYRAELRQVSVPINLRCWLILAAMICDNVKSRSLNDSLDDSVWFPFQFNIHINEVDEFLFDLHQQGNDLVLFKK